MSIYAERLMELSGYPECRPYSGDLVAISDGIRQDKARIAELELQLAQARAELEKAERDFNAARDANDRAVAELAAAQKDAKRWRAARTGVGRFFLATLSTNNPYPIMAVYEAHADDTIDAAIAQAKPEQTNTGDA